jgi:hypothetical protein
MPVRAITRLDALQEPPPEDEVAWLWHALRSGVPVAPLVVVPAALEAEHYRLNNLPERLRKLFTGVDLADPDEDDLEELAPAAQALVRDHALLDEVIDGLYGALEGLPDEVTVRRPGQGGRVLALGRPVLLEIKRVWAEAWTEEALALRLRSEVRLAPTPRPVLVHGAAVTEVPPPTAPSPLRPRRAWIDAAGRIVRVDLPPHGS